MNPPEASAFERAAGAIQEMLADDDLGPRLRADVELLRATEGAVRDLPCNLRGKGV